MAVVQFTQRGAYALSLCQAAVTFGVVLYFPSVWVQAFTCHPVVRNGTADLDAPAPVRGGSIALAMPLMATSLVATGFATTSMHLGESTLLGMDYSKDTLEQTGLWDVGFWAYCALSHTLVLLMVTSPGDAFAVGLSALLITYFLNRACAPKSAETRLTQENLNLLGYCAGVLAAFYCAQPGSARLTALFLMVVVDYFMGVGHTWDRDATLHTVCNCRLFYVCATSLCLAGMYGSWHDRLLMDPVERQ